LTQSPNKTTGMTLLHRYKRIILLAISFGICLPIILTSFYVSDGIGVRVQVSWADNNTHANSIEQSIQKERGQNGTNGTNNAKTATPKTIHIKRTTPAPPGKAP